MLQLVHSTSLHTCIGPKMRKRWAHIQPCSMHDVENHATMLVSRRPTNKEGGGGAGRGLRCGTRCQDEVHTHG
jgi:hypothetical protein